MHCYKLLMICFLLCKGTSADASEGAVSLTSTSEPPRAQTHETTPKGSTAVSKTVSSEPPSSSPTLVASEASVAESSEEAITTEAPLTTSKDSEVTTGQSPGSKNETSPAKNPKPSSPNEAPVNAARKAPEPHIAVSEAQPSANGSPLDTVESSATSTMGIPEEELTTDAGDRTTDHTTHEHSSPISTEDEVSTNAPESTDGPETAMRSLKDTKDLAEWKTNTADIAENDEVTTDIAVITTSIAEVSTNIGVTTSIAETETTDPGDLAEITTNAAEVATNLASITANVEDTTVITEAATSIAETTASIDEINTNIDDTTTTVEESTTDLTETKTNHAEATTDLAEITTNLPEATTEMATSRAPMSPRSPASESHIESNEIPSVVWFILILDGNCTHLARGRQAQRESGLKRQIIENLTRWLDAAKEDVAIPAGVVCTPEGRVHANLTLVRAGGAAVNITGRLKSLEDTKGPLFRFHGQDFYVYQILTADGFLNKDPDIPIDLKHTDVELLVYIAVGSTCAFLFLLAMALVGCKYCACRDQRKPFEFGDAPNANMRLEDYTLTRIPRPKLGYVEYCRGLTKHYCPLDERVASSPCNGMGMVRPGDTSVVPLEDDFRDGVLVRPANICGLGRTYHAGYVTDADGYCIHSTENLHRAHKVVDRYVDKGVDNPNFY